MADIQRIVAHLQSEWRTGLRLTTVAQAMAALGLPDDDEVRWQVGRELESEWMRQRSVSGFFRGLKWLTGPNPIRLLRWLPDVLFRLPRIQQEMRDWNPAVYTLTEDEKLIARHILRVCQRDQSVPLATAIAATLSLTSEAVECGLALLARLGFLQPTDDGYGLAPDHERFSRGLGFNFHTVTLAKGEVFNVP